MSARRKILTGRKPVALTGLSPESALTFRGPPNGPPMSVLGSPLWRTPRATGDRGANTKRRCLSPYGLFHRTRPRRSCPAPPSTPKAPGKGRQSQRPRTFGPAASVTGQRLLRPTAVPRHFHPTHVSAASSRPVDITFSSPPGRSPRYGVIDPPGWERHRPGSGGTSRCASPSPRASSSASAEDVPLFRPATGSTGQPRHQHPGL